MKRTGVIVGVTEDVLDADVAPMVSMLEERFPGVTFAIVTKAAGHIAFEFDDGEISPGWPRYPDVLLESR